MWQILLAGMVMFYLGMKGAVLHIHQYVMVVYIKDCK